MDWKALLKEFREKLAEAIKDKTDDEKTKLIAEATDALPQEARQHLHDLGHAEGEKAGKAEGSKSTAELTAERDRLKSEAEAKDREIEQLKQKNPDLAKIKSEYEEALVAKDKEIQAAKEAGEKALADERTASARRQLEAGLSSRLLTDSIARGIANDPALLSRLQVDADGNLKAYQADGKTPIAVASGQSPVDALVADVVSTLDKSLVRSTADGGSGATGGGGGSADEFAAIREEVKSQYGGSADDARKRLEAL